MQLHQWLWHRLDLIVIIFRKKKLIKNILAGDGSLRGVPAAISQDVIQMKKKRQCSLEWEFLATILDRLFLIVFILIVLVVTLGMMLTGRMAQLHYDDHL